MILKMLFGIICAQHNWEMYCWISLEFNERWVKNYSTIIHKRGIKEEQQCLRICYESLRMVDNWQFGLFSGFHKSKTEDGPLEVQALDQLRRRGDTFYEVITMIIFDILQHKNIFDFAIKEQFNWYSSNFKKCILKGGGLLKRLKLQTQNSHIKINILCQGFSNLFCIATLSKYFKNFATLEYIFFCCVIWYLVNSIDRFFNFFCMANKLKKCTFWKCPSFQCIFDTVPESLI